MRETKFRVWDKENKCILDVESIYFPLGKPSGKDISVYNKEADCYEWVYDYNLMQYTGYRDKDDTEIYEGDLLKFGVQDDIYEVFFDQGCFQLKKDDGEIDMLAKYGLMCFKVIGNIYEQQKLLK